MFPPPTHMNLRHRENGGAWHDRFITDVEANAFMDFNPSLGGAGASAGLLNQAIDLDLAELQGRRQHGRAARRGDVDGQLPHHGHGRRPRARLRRLT